MDGERLSGEECEAVLAYREALRAKVRATVDRARAAPYTDRNPSRRTPDDQRVAVASAAVEGRLRDLNREFLAGEW